jgi:polar amino acid transport system permease protein
VRLGACQKLALGLAADTNLMDSFALLFGPEGWSGLLLKGAAITILLAVTTLPFGFGGGLALALSRLSPHRAVRALCETYTTFFRGIPDLLVLFIVYFGLQALIDHVATALALDGHIELNAFAAGVISLAAVMAAYSSEVWFAALSALPKSQLDAARSLGFNQKQTFYFIQLPQACRIALPGLGNVWNNLLKDTSIISTLAVMDLLRAASEASRSTTRSILFFTAAATIYLIFSIASATLQGRIERHFNRNDA